MSVDEPWGPTHGPGRVKALLDLAMVEAKAAKLTATTDAIAGALVNLQWEVIKAAQDGDTNER